MLTDDNKFLKQVILFLAEEKYQQEVVDCGMEEELIGTPERSEHVDDTGTRRIETLEHEFESKEAWITDCISQWFDDVKIAFGYKEETSVCPTNQTSNPQS